MLRGWRHRECEREGRGRGAGGGSGKRSLKSEIVLHIGCRPHSLGARIAQLIECATQMSGAILTQIRVRDAARNFSLRGNFRCRLSSGVRTDPVCNRTHQHVCARYKSPTLAATPLCGHTAIPHTLTEMGSAALAAAVPQWGEATRISQELGQYSDKQRTKERKIRDNVTV